MSALNCEDMLMAKMAAADGEVTEFSKEANLHFEQCEKCQNEFEQMQNLDQLFIRQERLEHNADLWPLIENRIDDAQGKRIGWLPFAIVAVLLVGYKLFEMLPERDPGLTFKLVPLAIVVILFVLIRENPFRVNSEFMFER